MNSQVKIRFNWIKRQVTFLTCIVISTVWAKAYFYRLQLQPKMSETDKKQHFIVIDDHEAILEGTVPALQQKYPIAEIITAQDAQTAEQLIERYQPDLAIVDLSLPPHENAIATPEVGIQLLHKLMKSDLAPNIMVLSTNIKPLIQLKPMINAYEGGFAVMDKSLPIQSMLSTVEVALKGSIYLPKEVRARSEFDRKWIRVLQLKYQEGLSDKAIAKEMGITSRTVHNYWVRIQDALRVYDDPDKDLRVQVQMAARKAGFIS